MHLSQIDPKVILDDCPGLVIGDQIKIGGQKRVWRCKYSEEGYVLKALMGDDETLRRVKREIEIMQICNSPFLPKLGPIPLKELRLSTGAKLLYYLEQYIDGIALASVHKPMAPEDVVTLGLCVCEALRVLSKNGYLHRDIKPMNIIRKSLSEYVLIDAGLALDYDGDAISLPGCVVGTRPYLSPDQLTLHQKDLDIRSDLFSLGITLYECATGKHPFWNEEMPRGDVVYNISKTDCLPLESFNSEIPKPLSLVILKLLRKDREERYASLDQLCAALSEI